MSGNEKNDYNYLDFKKSYEVLLIHQQWRLGEDVPPSDPKELSTAMWVAISRLEVSIMQIEEVSYKKPANTNK